MTAADAAATMRATWWRTWYVAARRLVEPFPLSLLQLGMRVAIGLVFLNSGRLKVNSFEFAIRLFRDEYDLPIIDPVLAAQVATFVEVTVPMFLFAGLATRLATLPLLAMTAVIQILVFPQAWPTHVLWASILVFLLSRGPGVLSIDHVIETYVKGELSSARVWPYALVVGSLSLTIGLAIAAFPQLLLGARDIAPAVNWSFIILALAAFVVAYFGGVRDHSRTVVRVEAD